MSDEWPTRTAGESDDSYGWRVGFDDHYLEWWVLQKKSEEFRRGYIRGKREIDCLVEEAVDAERNYGEWE